MYLCVALYCSLYARGTKSEAVEHTIGRMESAVLKAMLHASFRLLEVYAAVVCACNSNKCWEATRFLRVFEQSLGLIQLNDRATQFLAEYSATRYRKQFTSVS